MWLGAPDLGSLALELGMYLGFVLKAQGREVKEQHSPSAFMSNAASMTKFFPLHSTGEKLPGMKKDCRALSSQKGFRRFVTS